MSKYKREINWGRELVQSLDLLCQSTDLVRFNSRTTWPPGFDWCSPSDPRYHRYGPGDPQNYQAVCECLT